ncbi:Leucine-rich repeat [Macleaya cordata]|uniref:Leucine-rich repeat n=1 Tax=Macleaya cordata TaxID=56857 RepID=A0A200RAL8_MACCD|nr:Leucine-rich repeat [Macleaya cordata]
MSIFTSTLTYLKKSFSFGCEAEKEKEVNLHTKPFAPMVNLRLLQINNVNLEGKFKLIPNELKWLQWKECPLEALPSDFSPSELAVLDLTRSKIKHIWDQRWWRGYKMAEKLKVLNLYNCYHLTATPDFSGHPHLEKLILELCTSLVKVHKSVGDMRTLILLNLRDCSNLEEFPNDISGLRCLESFVLSGCSKLKELPNDLSSMKSLISLLADGTAIEKLPDSISHLKRLERLSLNGCTSLKQLPNSIGQLCSLSELSLNHSALEELPDSIGSLTTLEILSLIGCRSIVTIPDSIGMLKSLLELFLDGSSITNLPASIGSLYHLKHLSVGRCQSLDHLPVSIGGLVSLVELKLDRTSIRELPDEIGNLTALEKLEMRNCKLLSDLPDSIGNMSSLTALVLLNVFIKKLPESIGLLKKLKILNVNKCKQLSKLPASIGNLNCLRKFQMEETGVAELPKEFGMLSSLMVLKMAKRPHLDEQPQNVGDHTEMTAPSARENPKLVVLPASFSNLYLLNNLDARYCKLSGMIPDDFEKLSSLEDLKLDYNNFCSLPSSLRGLSLLKSLTLSHCRQLTSLPPLPSRLTLIDITNCTALESISDLSNLESLQELRLTNCKNVALKKFNNLSVPGSEIPKWFVREVPSFSNRKNREIRDVIICVVISLSVQQQNQQDDLSGKLPLPAIVDIQAEILRGKRSMHTVGLELRGIPDSDEDQIYLCRFLHYTPFVLDLQEGDRIQVTVRNPPVFQGLQLKKYGIHLVFEDDDDADVDDDEESLDEAEQSVSEKLRRFFCSLEDYKEAVTGSSETERKMLQVEAADSGTSEAGREKQQIVGKRE